jgi:hypothetical protein
MPMESIINVKNKQNNSEIREEDEDSLFNSRKPSNLNTTFDVNV